MITRNGPTGQEAGPQDPFPALEFLSDPGPADPMEDETLDDLQCQGMFILQKKKAFRFGMDAVLLASFAGAGSKDRVLDLGTGTGIIPLLLAGRSKARHITGIEIQHDMARMAARSVARNRLDPRVTILRGDMRSAPRDLGRGCFDLVTANPPYTKAGHGDVNSTGGKAIARHEILIDLKSLIGVAAEMLKYGGRLAMIHRAERLCDLLSMMREQGIEPKVMRMIHPRPGEASKMFLLRGRKGSRPGLQVEPPLFVQDEQGGYSQELLNMYAGGSPGG